jgi:ubiquinone/menaquinone biosynthesis C-methylase UbiE
MAAKTERTPFADIDSAPPGLHALLFAGLDAMSRHPEIGRVRRTALTALRPAPGQRLLDAGTGTGDVARMLAATAGPAGRVVALDFSETLLAAARARHDGTEVEYVTGDVSALDRPDDEFDGVWCERVLQHVADPGRAIAELIRVTRPGGRVCLIDTDWDSLAFDGMPPQLAAAVLTHTRDRIGDHQSDMGRTLRRRLVAAGLRDLDVTPVTCSFGDPESAAVVLPMVNPAVPPEAFMSADGLRETWLSEVAEAGRRGEFLAVLTIWVAAGTV